MKRYFIVCFVATVNNKNNTCTGFAEFTTKDQNYLNKKTTLEQICKSYDVHLPIITNIIELTAEEFATWEDNNYTPDNE